jgi:hypothetical protein
MTLCLREEGGSFQTIQALHDKDFLLVNILKGIDTHWQLCEASLYRVQKTYGCSTAVQITLLRIFRFGQSRT